MMECTFVVGQKVVCWEVESIIERGSSKPGFEVGAIYTIRSIEPCGRGIGLQFDEVPEYIEDETLIHWDASCFRPVKPLSFWIGEKHALKVPA